MNWASPLRNRYFSFPTLYLPIWIWAFGLLVFFESAIAQTFLPKFRSYGLQEGLSTSGVTAICEDRQGKIWIGTDDGLNCHFGTYFKQFFQRKEGETGLNQSAISDLICDKSGQIWISTYGGGINLLDPVSQQFKPIPQPLQVLKWKQAFCIKEDERQRIWMGFNEGLAVFDPKTGRLDTISLCPDGKSRLEVQKIANDKQGNVFVATAFEGVVIYQYMQKPTVVDHISFRQLDAARSGIGFFNHLFAEDNSIYASSQHGLYRFSRENGETHWQKMSALPKAIHYAYFVDNARNTWTATNSGLEVKDKTGKKLPLDLPYQGSLRESGITTFYSDSRKGLWIGGSRGVHYHHPQMSKFQSFAFDPYLHENRLEITWTGFTENDKQFLIGSESGLFLFDAPTFRLKEIKSKTNSKPPITYKIIKCPDGKILAGTSEGIYQIVYSQNQWSCEKYAPQLNAFISDMFALADGMLLVATYDEKGLILLDKQGNIKETHVHNAAPNSLINNSISCLYPANNGNIWICTDNGISEYDPFGKTFNNEVWLKNPNKSFSPLIYGVADLDNEVWFASFGSGIMVYNKKTQKYSFLNRENGMPNESVYQLRLKGNTVYASTNKGLCCIDAKTKKIQVFTEGDGLQSNEFNHFASWTCQTSGNIYFGGLNGFDEVSNMLPSSNTYPSTVALSSASIVGSSQKLPLDGSPWQLQHHQQNIELEFAAINYLMPEKNSYQYWFGANNSNAVSMGTKNKITLVNLQPGQYTLNVNGSNSDGRWSSLPLSIPIDMEYPWWQTWWFRVLVFLIILGILLLIFRLYLKAQLKKQVLDFERQQAVRVERNRISSEMHDDLGSGLTSIKMQSELLKLKSGKEPSKELEQIATRADELVDNLNTIVWALNDRNDKLEAVVAYLRLFAAKQFDEHNIILHSDIEIVSSAANLEIPGEVRRNLYLILKESIHNLIKHAQASEAWLTLKAKENGIVVSLRDNGQGMKQNGKSLGGNGLLNMRERANQMKANIEVIEADGVEVKLMVPLYN